MADGGAGMAGDVQKWRRAGMRADAEWRARRRNLFDVDSASDAGRMRK
ncbi:MAG: hypothetical protein ACR2P5_09100 [Gammaproteobacteria bacterium]